LYFDFANILVFLVVGLGFILLNLVIAFLLRPKGVKTPGKLAIYECGEPTIGQAWIRFDIRFYTVALMFVVFDIEIALLFPWGVVFRDMVLEGQGWIAFLEAGTFITVLMAGLLYVWARGDLDWTAPGIAAPDASAREAETAAASSATNLSTVPRGSAPAAVERETVGAGAGGTNAGPR
jgi:NADH-quinone oxidoreductase subunit A